MPGCLAEAMLRANLFRQFSASHPFEKRRQRLCEPLCVVPNFGTNEKKEGAQEKNNENVDDPDGAAASLGPLCDPRNRGIHEISEEDRKQKCDQSSPRDIQKTH